MLTLRLLPEDERAGVADPERCVELAVPRRIEERLRRFGWITFAITVYVLCSWTIVAAIRGDL
ncbi:hypothetical protein [Streptomyces sp. NPDC001410]|uniref:hypothetical protein n=1 Tax=Streptomyces sp. NPDC001410 TaxID=3364574 RepID=UPI003681A93F